MTKFDSLDAHFNKVSFDVYCPLATIAEQFYTLAVHNRTPAGSFVIS